MMVIRQSQPVTFTLDDPDTTSVDESNFGWYMDLKEYDATNSKFNPLEGERVVRRPVVFGQVLLFVTNTPSSGAGSCSAGAGGSSFVMAVNAIDGGQPNFNTFDFDRDGVFESNFSYQIDGIVQNPGVLSKGGGKGVAANTVDKDSGQVIADDIKVLNYRPQGRKSWSIIR